MNSRHYNVIAESIEENYSKYDSFIIIYGTDTMAYTASQLSFMLENLNKTVVITGSQIPIAEWRNDAESNLIGALSVAEHKIPEVTIFFNGVLLRGNRSCKDSSTLLHAFVSPNYPVLAKYDVFLNFRTDLIIKPKRNTEKFSVFKMLERRIALIYIHPLITSSIFLSAFKKAKAIVLQTYGMGNFPLSRVDLVEIIEDAVLKYNKTVVIVSQCRKGFVRSEYASSVVLKKFGVILAEDMTIECVIAKLSYVIGKGFRGKDIKAQMLRNMRGELSIDADVAGPDGMTRANKVIESMGSSLEETTPEELNSMVKLIQPIVAQNAAFDGNVTKLSNLLEEGYDVNKLCQNGKAPLHIAVMRNDVNMVEFLLEKETINTDIIDNEGNSALYYACFNGNNKITSMLVF